jgi:hypothetical protein
LLLQSFLLQLAQSFCIVNAAVLTLPPEVNLSKGSLNPHSSSSSFRHPLSDNSEHQKAQSFLDVLVQLPFAALYIHKLQLMLSIDKQYYKELAQKEGHINRAKTHEEIIGRRHVTYTFSPNGTVEIAVKSSDTPFRLETDEYESIIFSFLGQVRDRLLYHVSDIRERHIPSIMEWILKACDLNKDVEIQNNCQMTLPDIQLKYAGRVFRLYIKSLHDRAVYRSEESLAPSQILPEALDNIAYPHRSVEAKIDELSKQLKQFMGSFPKCNSSHHSGGSQESQTTCREKEQAIRNLDQLDNSNGIVKGDR